MAQPGNEIELVLKFDRGYNGDATGSKYTDTRCTSGYEWSLTAWKTGKHYYSLSLECIRAPPRGGTADILFLTSFDPFSTIHEFEGRNNFSFHEGASVRTKNTFTTQHSPATIRARIVVHQQSAPLRNTLYDFTTAGTNSDVKLKVGESTFYANRGVLSIVSPVFSAMFNGEFSETHADEVPLEGIEPAAFEAFLGAVYPNGQEPTDDNFASLMELADRYDVEWLRNKCENACRDSVGRPIFERLHFAVRYRLTELQNELINSVGADGMKLLVAQENLAVLGPECLQKLLAKSIAFYPDKPS